MHKRATGDARGSKSLGKVRVPSHPGLRVCFAPHGVRNNNICESNTWLSTVGTARGMFAIAACHTRKRPCSAVLRA